MHARRHDPAGLGNIWSPTAPPATRCLLWPPRLEPGFSPPACRIGPARTVTSAPDGGIKRLPPAADDLAKRCRARRRRKPSQRGSKGMRKIFAVVGLLVALVAGPPVAPRSRRAPAARRALSSRSATGRPRSTVRRMSTTNGGLKRSLPTARHSLDEVENLVD